ncbi:hypothetical protein ACP70R_020219 [Stipagrostis hirtigluma subsp. patula]
MDGGGAAPPDAAANTTSPAPIAAVPAGVRVENCYVFKSRLQEYAQKVGLPTPEYHTLKEGPSHEPIFKSTVVVNNTKYESLPGFFSRKAAEQSAAEVALMEIVKSVPATGSIPAVQETGLCKNLLQEYAQKMNYAIPSYICTRQASGVAPFICTVEIGGIQYIGAAARTKKEAEIKAARTALLAIQGQSEGCANGATKYIVVPGQRQVKEIEKKPTETPKPLKVKRGGYKKKWNKRKFMRKTDQTVDSEQDGTRMAGDVDGSDTLQCVYVATIAGQQSSDATVPHPGEEARIVDHELLGYTAMLLHDEEARRVEQEPSRDAATVQSNKEGRIVIQEPPTDTAMLLNDEEDRRVEQEPFRDTSMVLPNEEARTVIQEPPTDTAMLLHIEEDRRVEQEPSRDTSAVQPIEKVLDVIQESPSNTAMLQPGEDARIVELEPHIETATVQSNEEARSINQELLSNPEMLKPNGEAITIGQETLTASVALQRNGEATCQEEGTPNNTTTIQHEETRTIAGTTQQC